MRLVLELARRVADVATAPARLEALRHDHAELEARILALELAGPARRRPRSPLDVFAHATR